MTLEELTFKSKKYDCGAADLEKVTDYSEDIEISDKSIQNAINFINKSSNENKIINSDLSKILIKKEDIDFLVNEMEITRSKAEKILMENKGELASTIEYLFNHYI
ncbi:unnamed protein product [Gordionus sp. m RMFG-2023]